MHASHPYTTLPSSAVWCGAVFLPVCIPYVYHNFAVKKLLLDVNVLEEDGKVHVHLGTSPNVRLG